MKSQQQRHAPSTKTAYHLSKRRQTLQQWKDGAIPLVHLADHQLTHKNNAACVSELANKTWHTIIGGIRISLNSGLSNSLPIYTHRLNHIKRTNTHKTSTTVIHTASERQAIASQKFDRVFGAHCIRPRIRAVYTTQMRCKSEQHEWCKYCD